MPRIKRICYCNVCRGKRQPVDSRKSGLHISLYGLYCDDNSNPKTDAKKDEKCCHDNASAEDSSFPNGSNSFSEFERNLDDCCHDSDSAKDSPFDTCSSVSELKRKNIGRLDKGDEKKSKW